MYLFFPYRWLGRILVLVSFLCCSSLQATDFTLFPRHWRAPGAGPWVMTESAQMIEEKHIELQSGLGFMHRPVAIYSDQGDLVDSILGHRLYSELGVNFGWEYGLNIGLVMPIILDQSGPKQSVANITDIRSGGLGDLYLFVRGRLFSDRWEKLRLAYQANASLPTSQVDFGGDEFLSLAPKVIADYRYRDFIFAANLGFTFRKKTEFLNFAVGSNLEWNVAVAYLFTSFHQLSLFAELYGQMNRFRFSGSHVLMDGLMGLRWDETQPWSFSLSYGRNLVNGYIGGDHQVVAMVSYGLDPKRRASPEDVIDQETQGKIKISDEEILLSEPIRFAPESDIMIENCEETLELLFGVLQENQWIEKIEIAVFTPNDPNVGASELHLAFRRAKKVRDHLEMLGLSPERITSQSYLGYKVQGADPSDREMKIKILQRSKR
ncbi:MAG: hypothetical protein KDD52_00460 [Bdellovibrionales bacterium]|nr:hypothetical protein [Bdellovibrionales bacterium]